MRALSVHGNQRGEGRIGLIIALVIAGIVIFVGVKLIPVKIRTYQFADYMREEAQKTAWNKKEDVLRAHLLQKARELNLPVTEKNLKTEMRSSEVFISTRFEIPIDLKVTTYVWKFENEARAPLF